MANRYWVGGTGNWDASTTTHWGSASGTADNASVPGTGDNVIFDTSSSAAEAAYTVTITATANCADFTMDGPSTTDATKVTWALNAALNIYGNLDLNGGTAGITTSSNSEYDITFRATSGTKTIRTYSVLILGNLVFNGSGGTFQLLDTLEIGNTNAAGNLTLTAGTFDANSKTVKLSGSTPTITGAFTFYDLTRANGASNTHTLSFASNITVSNTLTITGNSAINRLLIKSNTLGTARTITAAAISVSNADFQDITGAGDATWDMSAITGGSGNCGGNSMKALGAAAFTTADTWYWHADTGSVATYSFWYTETNGGGTRMASTRVPLPQDTLRFDDSSFTTGTRVITQNMPRIGSVDFTGATNTPAFSISANPEYVFGSITFISGMTVTSSNPVYLQGTSNSTIDNAGKIITSNTFYIQKPGAIVTLKNDFTTNGTTRINNGTFSCVDGANNWAFNLTSPDNKFLLVAGGTLTLGSATHNLIGVGSTIFSYTSGTITSFTGTIKLSGTLTSALTFACGTSVVYNNIWNATTGNYPLIITGSGTFNDFKIDAGREVKFTNSTNTTVTTFTALGTSGSHITISNTSSTTHATLTKAGGGVISGCDYIDIQEMTGSPASTWYIGANSTDTGSTTTNIYLQDPPAATAAITGTATASIKASDVVTGGKTIVITLAYEAWLPTASFDAQRQAIIDGLDSAQSEATGWNAEVRDKMAVTSVVRTSNSVVTVTLPASASYAITAPETITVTVPASAVARNGAITGSPTFDVALAGVSTGNFFLVF